ncbi:hypothetical protein ACFY2K_26120 [Kitasatospora sp. NPDC001309]|uniref:hypothetical protein n=1 Tax=Kitasatospora sp. NPDC001309 TaxID=3364013 RepID=UPI0036CA5BBD
MSAVGSEGRALLPALVASLAALWRALAVVAALGCSLALLRAVAALWGLLRGLLLYGLLGRCRRSELLANLRHLVHQVDPLCLADKG